MSADEFGQGSGATGPGNASPPPPPPGLFTDPQPAPPAPPAPPVPTAAYPAAAPVQPVATQAPVKKPRNRLLIGIIAGVLGICLLSTCALIAIGGLGDDTEKITLAETHYSAAISSVETATALLTDATDDPTSAKLDLASTTKALRTGRDEIAAARVAIEQLDESEGRTAYIESLNAATEALDGLEDMMGYLGTASSMFVEIEQAGKTSEKASDDLNDAIDAGNSKKYALMARKAQAAKTGFSKAAASFRKAHELDKSAGLDKAAEYADALEAQAAIVVRMAREGKAGQLSAYNKDIDLLNKSSAKADKIGEPAIVSDPDWTDKRLAAISETVEKAGALADELHLKALKALDYTD